VLAFVRWSRTAPWRVVGGGAGGEGGVQAWARARTKGRRRRREEARSARLLSGGLCRGRGIPVWEGMGWKEGG